LTAGSESHLVKELCAIINLAVQDQVAAVLGVVLPDVVKAEGLGLRHDADKDRKK
jgi:hypothetical protein